MAIDANTRLVMASGDPQPGNRNDTIVCLSSGINTKLAGRAVMADGGYRDNPEVIICTASRVTAASSRPENRTTTPAIARSAPGSDIPWPGSRLTRACATTVVLPGPGHHRRRNRHLHNIVLGRLIRERSAGNTRTQLRDIT